MNIIWHYWCGVKNSGFDEKYISYLLVSVNSLIKIGGVDPKRIYVTIEPKLLDTPCGRAAKKLGINFQSAPIYKNYSKQYGYAKLVKDFPEVDMIAQIDCDTIVTRKNIENDLINLNCGVNIGENYGCSAFKTINNRRGQQHFDHIASMSPDQASKYAAFKDMMKITFDADVDGWLEETKKEGILLGFFYVLRPKKLPTDFFRFLSFLNLFFEDDEAGLSFAKYHFKLQYGLVNLPNMPLICLSVGSMKDYNNIESIGHMPHPRGQEIDKEVLSMAEKICEEIGITK